MGYDVAKMWESHHEIKRLLVMGIRANEIGRRLGLDGGYVRDIINSPAFQSELMVMQAARDAATVDVVQVMEMEKGKNLSVLQEIRDNPASPLALRAKIAEDMLKSTGDLVNNRVDVSINDNRLKPSDIDSIRNNVREAKNLCFGRNNIVDAEIVED